MITELIETTRANNTGQLKTTDANMVLPITIPLYEFSRLPPLPYEGIKEDYCPHEIQEKADELIPLASEVGEFSIKRGKVRTARETLESTAGDFIDRRVSGKPQFIGWATGPDGKSYLVEFGFNSPTGTITKFLSEGR